MVEMAVVFPLLIMVVLGLVQFAIYFHARNVVVTAVQESAHAAAARGGSAGAGEDRANALLQAGLGKRIREHITIDPPDVGDETVTVTAHGSLPTFIPWFTFSDGPTRLNLPLNATAEVSRERFRAPSEHR
jgi:Flp pilus assembly protein TadG